VTPRRIVILGCSGSGKSTLARAIGAKIALPVVHLDALYWEPGWVECETQEFIRRVEAAHAGEAWVSDGNYASKTWPIRIPRAELILKLDCPRWLCLWRVTRRWLTHIGRTREDIGADCPEKIDLPFLEWIWNYEKRWPTYERELQGFGVEGRFRSLEARDIDALVRELG
jgi:adenylate kinase family enzyme